MLNGARSLAQAIPLPAVKDFKALEQIQETQEQNLVISDFLKESSRRYYRCITSYDDQGKKTVDRERVKQGEYYTRVFVVAAVVQKAKELAAAKNAKP